MELDKMIKICKVGLKQAKEQTNEYRYINPKWLDEIATGLTAGVKKTIQARLGGQFQLMNMRREP